jgi:pyruvate,water dikinase
LSDAQVLAVCRMAKQLERQFGGPQDIEWAIARPQAPHTEGTLMLLQCRPETVWSQKKPTASPHATGGTFGALGMQGLVNTLLTPVKIKQ